MFNWLEKYKPGPTVDEKMAPDGVVRNKPKKIHYYNALKDLYELPDITALPTLAVLEGMASDEGIVVYGDAAANQPREPGSYFTREAAFRSNGDLSFTYGEIANTGVERQNYLDGITPLTKNPTMDCSWDCNFFKLCQMHSAGEDWEEYAEMAFSTAEDRYADHNNMKRA